MLKIDPNMDDADGFYATLIDAHEGLSDDQSAALNARLVLIMANQIGETEVLKAAIDAAKELPR